MPVRAAALASLLVLAACGFPKTTSAPPGPVTAADVARAPNTTQESLESGRSMFVRKCNGCHGYPDLATIPDDRWPDIVARMGKKTDLSAAQQADVLAFVRAAKGRDDQTTNRSQAP